MLSLKQNDFFSTLLVSLKFSWQRTVINSVLRKQKSLVSCWYMH